MIRVNFVDFEPFAPICTQDLIRAAIVLPLGLAVIGISLCAWGFITLTTKGTT